MKRIVFTVTNELNYDQRMHRICASLSKAGYDVLLVGRKFKGSPPLKQQSYRQKRLSGFFSSGFLFYAEYNVRLFFLLLLLKTDAVCAIDLDTVLPCLFVTALKNKKRIYDAHELFTEMKEVITRPRIKKFWTRIERFAVPKFSKGYTVSLSIAEEFKRRYNVFYSVIWNLPLEKNPIENAAPNEKIILYQGAVNEARGLENLVLAMRHVDAPLHIYGDGNIFEKIKELVVQTGQENKILLKGKVPPCELQSITERAYIGINLIEPFGLNQLYSLSNKYFDYIQAGIPQLSMNFVEYSKLNEIFHVAILLDTIDVNEIAEQLNLLLNNPVLYVNLRNNCMRAGKVLHWEEEERKLVSFYNSFFAE